MANLNNFVQAVALMKRIDVLTQALANAVSDHSGSITVTSYEIPDSGDVVRVSAKAGALCADIVATDLAEQLKAAQDQFALIKL